MPINKIIYGNDILIDLTADTITADDLSEGKTAHIADGSIVTGTVKSTTIHNVYISSLTPTSSDGSDGDIWLIGSGGTVSGDVDYEYSTNYSTYDGSLDNLKSTSTSTYWWSGESQTSGKYVLITFDSPVTLTKVVTYGSKINDYIRSNNKLQVSSDGSNWTQAGSFSNSNTNTFTGKWNNVKYLRIYASSTQNYWLYINYITLTYEAEKSWQYSFTNIYKKIDGAWTELFDAATLETNAWIFNKLS